MRTLLTAVLFCCVLAGQTVFDADLTKGISQLPPGAKVTGGMWRDGWLVTDYGQRIVLDAGHPIKNGLLEVTFSRWDVAGNPAAYLQPPINYRTVPVAIFELPALGDPTSGGDSVRVQVANGDAPRNQQGIVRGKVDAVKEWRWMQPFGQWSDWKLDDRTPMTFKLEWRNGKAILHDVTGKQWPCKDDCKNAMDSLRYVTLGSDGESDASAIGYRFLRARLTDFDRTSQPQPKRRRVVFDADLTKGEAALPSFAAVLGGEWDNGWRVTGNRQRIVFDPGYAVKNGSLELTMTRKRTVQKGQKMNAFGLYEHPGIDQSDLHGDIFYVRIGITEISQGVQGNVKAFVKRGPKAAEDIAHVGMLWEERFGKFADWVLDDKTPVKVKFEWKNGAATFTDITGKTMLCPNNCDGEMDALRYVVLGGDRYDNGGSLAGLRFLSAKLTDYDAPEN